MMVEMVSVGALAQLARMVIEVPMPLVEPLVCFIYLFFGQLFAFINFCPIFSNIPYKFF